MAYYILRLTVLGRVIKRLASGAGGSQACKVRARRCDVRLVGLEPGFTKECKLVARGNDIPNIEILVRHLKEHCPGFITEQIHESGILEKEMLIPENLKEFRRTMRTHKVV